IRSGTSANNSKTQIARVRPNLRPQRASVLMSVVRSSSLLAERPHDLIVQGLHQIGQHGSLAGLHKRFDRHARQELHVAETLDLLRWHGDPDGVIALTGALVGRGIGGDARHYPLDFRRGARIERGEAQYGLLVELQLVDVLWIDFHLDREVVRLGDDEHDRITGRDHAADRVDRQLKNGSVLRGANVDAFELVLGRDLALDELADFAVDLAQFLRDFAGKILIYLQNLQRGLGDLAFCLRRGRNQLTAFTVEPGRLALERREPGELNQILVPKITHACKLSLDERNFFCLRILLRGETGNFLAKLGDPLLQLRLLAAASRFAQVEKLALAIHRRGAVRIARARHQLSRENDRIPPVALAFEPCLARHQLVQALGDDREVCARHGFVEAHDDVAGVYMISIAHTKFADDAAGWVLNLLDVGIDDQGSGGDNRP